MHRLNCPHNEMKLKQNSFRTVLFQFNFAVRTALRPGQFVFHNV